MPVTGPRAASSRSIACGARSNIAPSSTRHGVANGLPGSAAPETNLASAPMAPPARVSATKARPSAVNRLRSISRLCTPAASTAAAIASASSRVKASGFSSSRCLPALRRARCQVGLDRRRDGEGDGVAGAQQLVVRRERLGVVRRRELLGRLRAAGPDRHEAGAWARGQHRGVEHVGPRPRADQPYPQRHGTEHRRPLAAWTAGCSTESSSLGAGPRASAQCPAWRDPG